MANVKFPVNVNWKEVFHVNTLGWTIDTCRHTAKEAGYKWFLWNDWVFDTQTGLRTFAILENGEFVFWLDKIREAFVGSSITKISEKPFKSGLKMGRVVDVVPFNLSSAEPSRNKPAFKMDDNSYVECFKCKEI